MPRFFITGGSGMLGSALCFELSRENKVTASYNSFPVSSPLASFIKLDLTDKAATEDAIKKCKPEFIVHTAAMTDVDGCERDPDAARNLNVEVTKTIAGICKKESIKLIHISTDYVFDGRKGNYTETDKPNPLNAYATTKLDAELAVQAASPSFLIVRTSLFGWNLRSKKSFVEWVISSLAAGKQINVVSDQFSSMMLANDLALMIDKCKGLSGIYNIASHNAASKHDIAVMAACEFGLDASLIKPASSASLEPATKRADRPLDVSLDVSKVEAAISGQMPTLAEGIAHMKAKEKNFKQSFLA